MLSQRAYAKRIGVSPNAINKMVKSGVIPLHDGKIDPEEADRCRAERCDPMRIKRTPQKGKAAPKVDEGDSGHDESLAEARRRGEWLKNKQRELINGELEGRLVDREKTKRAVFSLSRQFREHWMNWPARVSSLLAAETGADPKKLQGALDRLVREHLAEMADSALKIK